MSKQGLFNDIKMPKTRRSILLMLKEHGHLTADELAAKLGISTVAVRRHLDGLRSDHLVHYEEVQRGMGRPNFVYTLADKAAEIFPRDYQGLAQDMLHIIKFTYGDEAVDLIFQERTKKIYEIYKRHVKGETLQERVIQLVELRRADGYMADWQGLEDGGYILSERNCPIHHVAQDCGQACQEDLTLFSQLLDADIVRTDHLLQGDHTCSYIIQVKGN